MSLISSIATVAKGLHKMT